MWDQTRTGKSHEDDFTLFKKTIQEIVGKTKTKIPQNTSKGRKKTPEPQDKSQYLVKKFLELKQFQKGLAAATLKSSDRESTTKPVKLKECTKYSSGESDKDTSTSSSNSSRCISSKPMKGRTEKEEEDNEFNTDDLSETSSEDSEPAKGHGTEESVSLETSSEYSKESKGSSRQSASGKEQNETFSVQSNKRKSALSASEMAIIKDLCRDLIKKDGGEDGDRAYKTEEPAKETKICEINLEGVAMKECPVVKECSQVPPCVEVTMEQLEKKEPENKIPVSNDVGVQSPEISDSTEAETDPPAEKNEINEKTQCDKELNYEVNDAAMVEGDPKADERFDAVHLEIVTKETFEEVKEWNQSIQEIVVSEKIVKAYVEDVTLVEEETKEVALCNMSDDDLIRKTIREMDQIDEEFKVEKTSPKNLQDENENDHLYEEKSVEENLQERLDYLQEQINSLRSQLEDARRHNEQEAKEIGFLSSLLIDRSTSLLRNGLDWDEWELKEMVRERLRQRKEAAAQDYEARLRVVDALCSAEMGKLEEAFETLVPLNATVSTWDQPIAPPDIRSSWQTQDYFFEVTTSMNLSSSDEKGISGTISTKELPSLTERKAGGQ